MSMTEINKHLGSSIEEVIADFVKDDPEAQEMMDKENLINMISHYVRDLRQENGMTQAELAEKLGTKQSSIARLENGNLNRLPNLEFLSKIARVFNKRLGLMIN